MHCAGDTKNPAPSPYRNFPSLNFGLPRSREPAQTSISSHYLHKSHFLIFSGLFLLPSGTHPSCSTVPQAGPSAPATPAGSVLLDNQATLCAQGFLVPSTAAAQLWFNPSSCPGSIQICHLTERGHSPFAPSAPLLVLWDLRSLLAPLYHKARLVGRHQALPVLLWELLLRQLCLLELPDVLLATPSPELLPLRVPRPCSPLKIKLQGPCFPNSFHLISHKANTTTGSSSNQGYFSQHA